MNIRTLRLGVSFLGLVAWAGSVLGAPVTVESLLAQRTAPPGVVFEIVDGDPGALEFALPWVRDASQKLKSRFPKLPMALVTHGQEMFALQSHKRADAPAVHRLAESLSKDGIPVHVCETYAGWRGIGAENFPAYIDVAPAGPTQIRNYEALDYVRVVVPRAAALRKR